MKHVRYDHRKGIIKKPLRRLLLAYFSYLFLFTPLMFPTESIVYADGIYDPPEALEPIAELVVEVPVEQTTVATIYVPPPTPNASRRAVQSSQGNLYFKNQCVWWAYERRLQIGNPVPGNWHNAYQWLGYAQVMGWPTGSEPRVGAVGTRGNHVVVIERVNADGTVYLSEMNFDYNGGFRYRTAPASNFYYIY